MVDTCQAMTLFDEIDSRDVLCIGSSVRGENSYARGVSEKWHPKKSTYRTSDTRSLFFALLFSRLLRLGSGPRAYGSS